MDNEKHQNLSKYLNHRSREICKDNGCTEDNHRCESYAYINPGMGLLGVCAPDFFQGSSSPYAAISLPWTGTMAELRKEVEDQCCDF